MHIVFAGEQPTPEQRRAAAMHSLIDRAKTERMVNTALPLLRTLREQLRELTKEGLEDSRLDRMRHDAATLVDDLQNFLVMPPPPDPPGGT